MTCREYFKKHGFTEYEDVGHCPFEYGFNVPCLCSNGGCTACWNQEAPDTIIKRHPLD